MDVLRSNMIAALGIAIGIQERIEKDCGYTSHSCFLAGIKEVQEAVKKGEQISLKGKVD